MAATARQLHTQSRTRTRSHLKDVSKRRNARVRRVAATSWINGRKDKFDSALRWAAAAKSHRTALDVTQNEVAAHYEVTGATVCHWESGMYFGWNKDALHEYQAVCNSLAE